MLEGKASEELGPASRGGHLEGSGRAGSVATTSPRHAATPAACPCSAGGLSGTKALAKLQASGAVGHPDPPAGTGMLIPAETRGGAARTPRQPLLQPRCFSGRLEGQPVLTRGLRSCQLWPQLLIGTMGLHKTETYGRARGCGRT